MNDRLNPFNPDRPELGYKDPLDETPYVSYHKLSSFRQCPGMIHLREISPIDRKLEDTRNAMVGTVVHTLCEAYLKKECSLEEMYGLISKTAMDAERRSSPQWHGNGDRAKVLSSIPRHVANMERLLEAFDITPENSTPERPIKYRGETLVIAGRIDITQHHDDGTISLYDLKASQDPRNIDHDQMRFYYLCCVANGEVPSSGAFLHTVDGTCATVQRNGAEEARLLKEAYAVAIKIKQGELPFIPGWHCNWCDHKMVCPASMAKGRKVDEHDDEKGWSSW